MPADLPAIPSTMRIHQVVTLSRGTILYHDVSCICRNLECDCQRMTAMRVLQMTREKIPHTAHQMKCSGTTQRLLGSDVPAA
ncbi:uncharacterized protein AKAME5_000865000 [Lates japonicus]|uniref:Uncharacterized protein n=1 Tax=Lates japonicus TaxID=270547 RepID=A0AAD3MMM9_LATJO|nr:uncharacterized protein AKAME5_000865000 [Lates japonicus]